jgi:hypothetical protein
LRALLHLGSIVRLDEAIQVVPHSWKG